MNKSEYINSTMEFLKEQKRLPHLSEDNVKQVIIKDGEETVRELRSSVRANKFFGSWEGYLKHLFDTKTITIKMLSEILNDTEARIRNIINSSVKNPDVKLRRGVHNVLGIDYYEDILTPYHSKCIDCKKKCKQNYYIDIVACKRYSKK